MSVGNDLRQAVRQLARRPAVPLVVALTLAVGIGATTVAYSVADAVLWHPLPFRNADRLVRVSVNDPQRAAGEILRSWPAASYLFDGLYPYSLDSAIVAGGAEPEAATIGMVPAGLIDALGVRPVAGRTFDAADAHSTPDVVIVNMALWRRLRPGASPADAIGRAVRVDNVPQTIIGVMPSEFDFPVGRVALWRPYVPNPNAHRITALGVLTKGASIPSTRSNDSVQVTPFVRSDRTTSLALRFVFAAAVLLLIIAVANSANLLLADAVRRDIELAVRISLGASWRRLASQMMAETLIVSGVAVGIAVIGSTWALGVLVTRIPYLLFFQALRPIELDWRALTFGVTAAAIGGLGASTLSILRARGLSAPTALRGQTSGLKSQTLSRSVLTAAQIAIAFALLACAGVLSTSLHRMTDIDPGFDASHLVDVVVQVPVWRYPTDADTKAALILARDEALRLPGVVNATVTHAMPPGLAELRAADMELDTGAHLGSAGQVAYAPIDDAFLATLGIPLIAGRVFDSRDRQDSGPVAIVSQSLAGLLAGDGRVIGRRFRETDKAPWRTVVGIARDILNAGVESSTTALAFYTPRNQSPAWWFEGLVVRTQQAPEFLVPEIRAAFHRAMPDAPIVDVTTGAEAVASTNQRVAFAAALMSAIAGLALALALVGVYATFWSMVRQRTREIGVRLALGASPSDIRRMVVTRGLWLALAGVAAGLPVALLAARGVRSQLVGTVAGEPMTIGVIATALAAAAIAATYIPARRASHVNPVEVLRQS